MGDCRTDEQIAQDEIVQEAAARIEALELSGYVDTADREAVIHSALNRYTEGLRAELQTMTEVAGSGAEIIADLNRAGVAYIDRIAELEGLLAEFLGAEKRRNDGKGYLADTVRRAEIALAPEPKPEQEK